MQMENGNLNLTRQNHIAEFQFERFLLIWKWTYFRYDYQRPDNLCRCWNQESFMPRGLLQVQRFGRLTTNNFIPIWIINVSCQVYMSLCFLGFHVRTAAVSPSFPLIFSDRSDLNTEYIDIKVKTRPPGLLLRNILVAALQWGRGKMFLRKKRSILSCCRYNFIMRFGNDFTVI